MSDAATATKGHNKPPITAPSDEDTLEDLQARFPELDAEMAQIEKDLATYPEELTLKDEDVAKALQDLLGKMRKHKTILGAHKKSEKGPWEKVVNVVKNFFTVREEKIKGLLDRWDAVHEDYLLKVKDEKARVAEAEAEKKRKEAEAARLAQEAAEKKRLEAEAAAAEALKREQEATARRLEEERKQKEAEAAAAAAAAEEKRLNDEKKARDREEKERNAESLKQIRRHMKDAERLHAGAEEAGDEVDDGVVRQLDALIRPGGIVGLLASGIQDSALLDDDDRTEVEAVRARLGAMRAAVHARLDTKEKRRRARELKEQEERDKQRAEERRLQREKEDKEHAEAKAKREAAEKAEADAKAAKARATEDARGARADQREAFTDQKAAGKDAARAGQSADRLENQADRIDRKAAEGPGSLRAELGTSGNLTYRWKHIMPEDEDGLRAICGILGPHLTSDAISGAVFRIMQTRIPGFMGERVEPEDLPGVVFVRESDNQIRGA